MINYTWDHSVFICKTLSKLWPTDVRTEGPRHRASEATESYAGVMNTSWRTHTAEETPSLGRGDMKARRAHGTQRQRVAASLASLRPPRAPSQGAPAQAGWPKRCAARGSQVSARLLASRPRPPGAAFPLPHASYHLPLPSPSAPRPCDLSLCTSPPSTLNALSMQSKLRHQVPEGITI